MNSDCTPVTEVDVVSPAVLTGFAVAVTPVLSLTALIAAATAMALARFSLRYGILADPFSAASRGWSHPACARHGLARNRALFRPAALSFCINPGLQRRLR